MADLLLVASLWFLVYGLWLVTANTADCFGTSLSHKAFFLAMTLRMGIK